MEVTPLFAIFQGGRPTKLNGKLASKFAETEVALFIKLDKPSFPTM